MPPLDQMLKESNRAEEESNEKGNILPIVSGELLRVSNLFRFHI